MPPRYRSPVLFEESRGAGVIKWGEAELRTLKGPWAGSPLRYLLWEVLVIEELLEVTPGGLHRFREGLVGVGRQNGKSIIGSTLGLEALYRGPVGSEVYSAAGDKQQARIVFNEARAQVRASPRLSRQAKVYRDAIEIPATGNVYRVLSADAKLQQGLSPYFVVFDEVHVQPNEDLWNAMKFGMAARPGAILLGITTAGDHEDSLAGRLYEYGMQVAGGEVEDPSFFFMWWEPWDPNCELFDREAWAEANPALLEGVLDYDEMGQAAARTLPGAFRRFRLNQWVAHGGTRWMDMNAWDLCADPALSLAPRSRILVSFDGSVDEDATALLVWDASQPVPTITEVHVWERLPEDGDDWEVDREDVDRVVDSLFSEYRVVKMGCDPAYWRSEIQKWQKRYGVAKVLEWPVTDARMGAPVTEVYKRVKEGTFRHNGDPVLRRHVRNAVTKPIRGGEYTIRKQEPKSTHKIDAAAATCIGMDLWERYAHRKAVLRSR